MQENFWDPCSFFFAETVGFRRSVPDEMQRAEAPENDRSRNAVLRCPLRLAAFCIGIWLIEIAVFLYVIRIGLEQQGDEIHYHADGKKTAGEKIQNAHTGFALIKFVCADES